MCTRRIGWASLVSLALLAAVLLACASSPEPRFYILEATATTSPAADTGLVVVVGPLRLPEHLNRDKLASREERYRLLVHDYDRWAEPLDDNVTSIVAENLSRLLPTEIVVAYPESLPDPDFTVRAQFMEFGPAPSGEVHLRALWTVEAASGSQVARRRTSIREPRTSPGIIGNVAAMSTALAKLSEEIAATLRESNERASPETSSPGGGRP